jgi:hypothetical protein
LVLNIKTVVVLLAIFKMKLGTYWEFKAQCLENIMARVNHLEIRPQVPPVAQPYGPLFQATRYV